MDKLGIQNHFDKHGSSPADSVIPITFDWLMDFPEKYLNKIQQISLSIVYNLIIN
jgi:hypothetical protein